MNPTPDDLLAMRIVAHLGEEPTVPAHVAHRLAQARAVALTRSRTSREPVWLGSTLALRAIGPFRARIALGLATAALVAGYCLSLANQDSRFDVYPWHAEDDSGRYVELLQD